MTDGPTSQLDTVELTGFQDIEEEKKGNEAIRSFCILLSAQLTPMLVRRGLCA